VTVTVTVVVISVVVASVRDFVTSENSHLNDIEYKAGNSSHKHNVFLDGRGVLKSLISGE
jgi:hypothetical protein